jgi:hypothetical protein
MVILRVRHLFKAFSWYYTAGLCQNKYDAKVHNAFAKKHWNLFLRGKNETKT